MSSTGCTADETKSLLKRGQPRPFKMRTGRWKSCESLSAKQGHAPMQRPFPEPRINCALLITFCLFSQTPQLM